MKLKQILVVQKWNWDYQSMKSKQVETIIHFFLQWTS